MKRKVTMIMLFFIGLFYLVSCKTDFEINEKKYVPFEIKVTDGCGGEWILTEENTTYEGALKLSFNDGKEREFRCTHFRFLEVVENNRNCWWKDCEWKRNPSKSDYYIEKSINYKETEEANYQKKDDGIVDDVGLYFVRFSGSRNGMWDDYKGYKIFIEVTE